MSQLILCFAVALSAQVAQYRPAPDAEVERAARDYRIQVYETFRTQRDEYNARREVGDKLLSDWRAAYQPHEYRADVLAWFRQAKQFSLEGEIAGLPEPPYLPEAPRAIAGEQNPAAPQTQPQQEGIEFHVFSSPESGNVDGGFATQPAPAPSDNKPYEGPSYMPSKFLRSIQRAILSSAGGTGDSKSSDETAKPDTAEPFAAPADPAKPMVDPFAPPADAAKSSDEPPAPPGYDPFLAPADSTEPLVDPFAPVSN